MKRFVYALAAAALLAPLAASAQPAKEADAGGKTIFVNADGMALYTFDKDEAGMSNCYDKCAVNWPPLAAADDAQAEGDWTIVERTDGTRMWAYDGQPLYTFIKDEKPGDMTGDGVNGVWHLATPK